VSTGDGRRVEERMGLVSEVGDGGCELVSFSEGDDVDFFEEVDVEFEEDVAGDFVFCGSGTGRKRSALSPRPRV